MNDLIFMVQDDSVTMRKLVIMALEKSGYATVIQSENGHEGIKLLKSHPEINFILTDWNMPIMNGLAFVADARKLRPEIPIVMVTTRGVKEDIVSAMKAGVNSYLLKPFTPEMMKKKVADVLSMLV